MTITLDKAVEARLEKEAAERSMEPHAYPENLLTRMLQQVPSFTFGAYVRPTETPAWVYELKLAVTSPADSATGSHPFIGAWPGEETEEELMQMAQRIDDEDAGRV